MPKKLTTWMQLQCERYVLLESHISNNETAVKRFFTMRNTKPHGFTGKFYQMIKEEMKLADTHPTRLMKKNCFSTIP